MLRLRICPQCQEETYSQKAYFCHRCGAELSPPPEVDQPEADKGRTEPDVKEKPTKKRTMVLVVVAAFMVSLVAAAGGGIYYFQIKPSWSSVPSLPPPPKNEAFIADVSFEVPNHPFSAKGLSEIVPADVDLYLLSADPELLLPVLVSAEDWSTIESVLAEKVGLSTAEFASFLEDEFAVIQESTASAFLARVRDVDFLEQKIAEVEEFNSWSAKIVGGVLVIANSPDLIRAIEEAQKKLTLNLSLTSTFTEARQKLPQAGQIFYYGKKRLDFIPASIKGDAFVVSRKDNGILVTGL